MDIELGRIWDKTEKNTGALGCSENDISRAV